MSFSGSILDLGVADVLEFLSISQRTGVLRFESPDDRTISFVLADGKLLSATDSMRAHGLGQVLRRSAGITEEVIDRAVANQQQSTEHRPLGSILVEMGAVTAGQVEDAVVRLIEASVTDLVGWSEGSFTFEPCEVKHVDSVGHFPALLRGDTEMDVRNVLMEAVRLFDEAQHARGEALRRRTQIGGPRDREDAADAAPTPAPQGDATRSDGDGEERAEANASGGTGFEDLDLDQALFQSRHGQQRLRDRALILVSDDSALRAMLMRHCASCGWDMYSASVVQEARPQLVRLSKTDTEVALIGDLSIGTFGNFSPVGRMPGARRLRKEFPHVPLLLIAEDLPLDTHLMALRLGAHLVLQKPRRADSPTTFNARFDIFRQQLLAAVEGAFLGASQAAIATRSVDDELRSLRDRVRELRNRSARSTVSLSLLHHVAETTERAVLLLRRRGELLGIGAFGHGRGGKLVRDLVVGARFKLDEFPAIARCVEGGAPVQGDLSREKGFETFFAKIGRPLQDQSLLLPIEALGRVVAVVYGDNGSDRRPLISAYGLEVLATQTGLMLENILLQRGVDGKSGGPLSGDDVPTDDSSVDPLSPATP